MLHLMLYLWLQNTFIMKLTYKKSNLYKTRGGCAVPSSASKAHAFWVQWSFFFGLNCWWLNCWMVKLSFGEIGWIESWWNKRGAELCQAQPAKHKVFGSNGAFFLVWIAACELLLMNSCFWIPYTNFPICPSFIISWNLSHFWWRILTNRSRKEISET